MVADNILVPGAPAYRAHMRHNDGTLWHTTEHRTHAEYQSVIKDLVLESDYLGTQASTLVPADLNVDPSSPGRRCTAGGRLRDPAGHQVLRGGPRHDGRR